MLKKGIDEISKPDLMIKDARLKGIVPGTVFRGLGLSREGIIINNQRKNLTISSVRTKIPRINFEGIVIIKMARPYVLKYAFQLYQSEICVRKIIEKQKNEIIRYNVVIRRIADLE